MNKKVLLIIGVVVLIIGVIIGITIINSSSKELELTYKTNGGVPFKWEFEIEDESVVEFVKSYVVDDENTGGKVGAPIYTNYVFKGLKKGNTTITFKYVSIIDGSISTEETLNIKVDGKKKISLVAIPKQ